MHGGARWIESLVREIGLADDRCGRRGERRRAELIGDQEAPTGGADQEQDRRKAEQIVLKLFPEQGNAARGVARSGTLTLGLELGMTDTEMPAWLRSIGLRLLKTALHSAQLRAHFLELAVW